MNNEVLKVLEDTKIAFETGKQFDFFICIHVLRMTNTLNSDEPNDTVNYIQANKPSKTLFPKIYNHKSFVKIPSFTAFWRATSPDNDKRYNDRWVNEIVYPQKIKYLELLINKLKSEL